MMILMVNNGNQMRLKKDYTPFSIQQNTVAEERVEGDSIIRTHSFDNKKRRDIYT